MVSYRIYVLDSEDRVAAVVEREMESDAAATRAAEALRGDAPAAEVWRGAELVSRTGAVFAPFAASQDLSRSDLRRV
ncbi:MAG TPA: hypothetical protein VGG92_01125 [Caulobacteraceae bacterium]|jgi:hypothetical protein